MMLLWTLLPSTARSSPPSSSSAEFLEHINSIHDVNVDNIYFELQCSPGFPHPELLGDTPDPFFVDHPGVLDTLRHEAAHVGQHGEHEGDADNAEAEAEHSAAECGGGKVAVTWPPIFVSKCNGVIMLYIATFHYLLLSKLSNRRSMTEQSPS